MNIRLRSWKRTCRCVQRNDPCAQLLVSGTGGYAAGVWGNAEKADQKLREMEKRALLAERQRDDALEKAKEFRLKFYETATQLEEEQERTWNFMHRSTVIMKIHLFLLQKPSGGKRLQTAGKKQDGNPVDSQDIKGMAEKAGAYTSGNPPSATRRSAWRLCF